MQQYLIILETNHRNSCNEAMKKVLAEKPMFGIEQEYTFLDHDGHPFGWPKQGFPAPQGLHHFNIKFCSCIFQGQRLTDCKFLSKLYTALDNYDSLGLHP